MMPPEPPRRRRARPVAEVPLDALLPQLDDLAKGWLLALVEQAPLEQAPAIMNPDLSRDGPRVCGAVVRALAEDHDLRRLAPDGALRALAGSVGELAGAADPVDASRAVDALRAVVWAALLLELRAPDGELVARLSERLAAVCETVRDAVLLGSAGMATPASIVGPAPVSAVRAAPAPEPATGPAAAAAPDPAPRLWISALDDEIQESGGGGLSLLLAELEDSARLVGTGTGTGASAMFSQFAQALRATVRHQDILVCETDARAWVIARGAGRADAQALGSRISAAVAEKAPWEGTPLATSVGVAVLGEDGRTSAELIDAAMQARMRASAKGSG